MMVPLAANTRHHQTIGQSIARPVCSRRNAACMTWCTPHTQPSFRLREHWSKPNGKAGGLAAPTGQTSARMECKKTMGALRKANPSNTTTTKTTHGSQASLVKETRGCAENAAKPAYARATVGRRLPLARAAETGAPRIRVPKATIEHKQHKLGRDIDDRTQATQVGAHRADGLTEALAASPQAHPPRSTSNKTMPQCFCTNGSRHRHGRRKKLNSHPPNIGHILCTSGPHRNRHPSRATDPTLDKPAWRHNH